MEERTDKTTKRAGARARVALWKAALGEGPGETPGPAGRALLADLRKLWLTREEEQRRAMREPPFPLPVDLAARPLSALWGWWPGVSEQFSPEGLAFTLSSHHQDYRLVKHEHCR